MCVWVDKIMDKKGNILETRLHMRYVLNPTPHINDNLYSHEP